MRMLTPLIVLILLAGAIYTAFGIYSFKPKQLDPPQFDVETPESEDVQRTIEGKKRKLELPNQLEARKERMLARIKPALKKYKNFIDNTPSPASGALKVLYKLMRDLQLPILYPDRANTDQKGVLNFTELALNNVNVGHVIDKDSDIIECNVSPENIHNVMIGSGAQNTLSCGVKPSVPGDVRIYIAGPDDDKIEDKGGHTIINAGSGKDTIVTGRGSTIVYVEPGWGSNTLKTSCEGAKLDPDRFPAQMPAPWQYKYAHFIVFAPGIAADDIAYKDGVIRHRDTDDKIMINGNCYNYIFANDLGLE